MGLSTVRTLAILRGVWVGHVLPRFLLGPLFGLPQFLSYFPFQNRLVDIYNRKLSASNILNDNLETF